MVDKDVQLKRNLEEQIEKDLKEKQKALKESAQISRQLHRAAAKEEQNVIENEKWDKWQKYTDETVDRGQQGYDTWVAAMSAIVMNCRMGVAAVHSSDIYGSILGVATGPVSDLYHNMTNNPPLEKVEVPDLQHFVEFTDDKKLNLNSISANMRRSDGREFTPEQASIIENTMQKGIALWLDNNGYKQGATKDVFLSKHDNTQLTKDVFEELRDDPDRGLDEFLSGRYDMNIQRASAPRPSM